MDWLNPGSLSTVRRETRMNEYVIDLCFAAVMAICVIAGPAVIGALVALISSGS